MAVTLIYTWDMKKVVVQNLGSFKTQEKTITTSPGVSYDQAMTTDHGSQVKTDLLDTDMFTVELNKNTKVMKLFHNQNELLSVTHDDRTYVERLFTTLLNTVKQKMRFWSTN
jgi:hypothetical protein